MDVKIDEATSRAMFEQATVTSRVSLFSLPN